MTGLNGLLAKGITSIGLGETSMKIINQLKHGDANHEINLQDVAKNSAINVIMSGGINPAGLLGGSLRQTVDDMNILKKGIKALDGAVDAAGNPAAPGIDYHEGQLGGITVKTYTIVAPDGGIMVTTVPQSSLFDDSGAMHAHKDAYDAIVNQSVAQAQQEMESALERQGIESVEAQIESVIGQMEYQSASADISINQPEHISTATPPTPTFA